MLTEITPVAFSLKYAAFRGSEFSTSLFSYLCYPSFFLDALAHDSLSGRDRAGDELVFHTRESCGHTPKRVQ